MATHDRGRPAAGSTAPPGGTVYGAGGTPLAPSTRPNRDRLMIGAAIAGSLGLLAGVLFATGLTPFGPPEGGAPAAAGSPSWREHPTGEPTGSPTPEPTAASPSPSPTAAAPPTGTLKSVASSLCLEVVAQPGVDGAPVQQMPCTGAPAQRGRLDRAGDIITVVNAATGGCLDVVGASRDNQVPVQQWSCADVPQQHWRAAPAGNGFALVSLASDKCVDVPSASQDPGVRIQQFDCNGTGAQQWIFTG